MKFDIIYSDPNWEYNNNLENRPELESNVEEFSFVGFNPQKHLFSTRYIVDGKFFGSYIVVNTVSELDNLISLRGLDEKIDGYFGKSYRLQSCITLYRKRKDRLNSLKLLLHQLCFIGGIALKARLIDLDFLLSDTGLLHEAMHELNYPEEFQYRPEVALKCKKFDKIMLELGF